MENRAKTLKAQNTRRQILDAALELFQSRGFDKTTMRDIAERAGLAVGAAYYYFDTKESIVLAFYAETQQAAEDHLRETLAAGCDFNTGMRDIIWYRLELLRPYRAFITVLASHLDPHHVVSPFGPATSDLRQRSVAMVAEAMKHSRLKAAKGLEPHLPLLLWLVQMAITFFWIHDDSEEQQRTQRLLEVVLDVVCAGVRLSRNPLFRRFNRGLQQAMAIIEEMMT